MHANLPTARKISHAKKGKKKKKKWAFIKPHLKCNNSQKGFEVKMSLHRNLIPAILKALVIVSNWRKQKRHAIYMTLTKNQKARASENKNEILHMLCAEKLKKKKHPRLPLFLSLS